MPQERASLLTAVIPVYRNASTLGELIRRLSDVSESIPMPLEMVFVDDACPEGSGELLEALGRDDPRIRLIRHPSNRGQQQAIRNGLKAAREGYVVVLDADLQDPPEVVARQYARMVETGVDAVFAVRDNPYQGRLRMLSSRLYKWLLNRWIGLPRGAGAFVLMSDVMVRQVLAFHTRGFYLSGLVCRTGLPINSVHHRREQRTAGESAYTSAMRWQAAVANIQCILESR